MAAGTALLLLSCDLQDPGLRPDVDASFDGASPGSGGSGGSTGGGGGSSAAGGIRTAGGSSGGGGRFTAGKAGVPDASLRDGNTEASAAGHGGTGPNCVAGLPCTPAPCEEGLTTCNGDAGTCEKKGNVQNGIECDLPDAGRGACHGGTCVACNAGADCSVPNSCQLSQIVCSTGSPVCTLQRDAADGSPCGPSDLYCNGGQCKACVEGSSCPVPGKPCNRGQAHCVNGAIQCSDLGTPVAKGTPCGTDMVCNGTACVACAANRPCVPANACDTGLTSCQSGGQTCADQGARTDSPSCDDGNKCTRTDICQNGVCSGSNPVGCTPSDACHKAGSCDALTGQCSNPVQSDGFACGTGMTCQQGTCDCSAGTTACGGRCVNLTGDAANCGACGHSCSPGLCSGSKCQRWKVQTLTGDCGGLVSDGTNVVWLDAASNSVLQKPAIGGSGAPLNLAMTSIQIGSIQSPSGTQIALANGLVGWNLLKPFTLAKATEGTVSSGTTGATYGSLDDIIVMSGAAMHPSGTAVYFALTDLSLSPPQGIVKCPTGQGLCTMLLMTSGLSGNGDDIVATMDSILWTEPNAGTVRRLTLADNSTATIAANQGTPRWLAIDAMYAYWINVLDPTTFSAARALQSSSGSSTPVVPTSSGQATGIATDGKWIYIAGSLGNATTNVSYAPVTGVASGFGQTLSSGGVVTPHTLVAAGGKVFWFDSGDKTIYAIAAP